MGSSVAGVFLCELGKLSGEEGVDARANSGSAACEVNVDAHLMEGHERTEAHAASEQGLDAGLGEKLHGSEAAALLVGRVVHGGHIQDFPVFDFDEGVDVTVTEVHAHFGIEAPGRQEGTARRVFIEGNPLPAVGPAVWFGNFQFLPLGALRERILFHSSRI